MMNQSQERCISCAAPPATAAGQQWIGRTLISGLCVLVAVGLWKTRGSAHDEPVVAVRRCQAVMGTTCSLAVVVPLGNRDEAARLLSRTEKALREVEARMSCWLADSEISRLNAAGAGQPIELSPPSLEILLAARDACDATDGAFDATCGPVLQVWREAVQQQREPTQGQIDAARSATGWHHLELTDRQAVKHLAQARVDLGGIAKGYAIHRAAQILWAEDVEGGQVEVGGDVACFGHPPHEESWGVDIQDPFGPGVLLKLRLSEQAVCTSGNYARFFQIGGRRYSHIIDPRTGRPVEGVVSATVVAANAMTADVWATALSALGAEGLDRLPAGVEALLVVGNPHAHKLICTPGMRALIEGEPPEGLQVRARVAETATACGMP